MKVANSFSRAVILSILTLGAIWAEPCFSSEVRIEIQGSKVRLSWPAEMDFPDEGLVWPEFTVKRSRDLVHWSTLPGKVRGVSGRSGPVLNLTFDQQGGSEFFQVIADPNPTAPDELGQGGEEVLGYASEFADEINRLGLMSLEEFAVSVPQPAYLPQLSWEPTTAEFWTNFYTNGAFRLNAAELEKFRTKGFVVSERLGDLSFGGLYYQVFHGDLPVLVTADSVLQAWHRTYLSMLEELEEVELATLVEQVITNMPAHLPALWEQYGNAPLRESILDADYFLTVARSLWAGGEVPSSLSVPGQQQRITDMLAHINSLQLREVLLFGTNRWVDFSQFKVRGHYNNSERLQRYFRTMIWCGRTDLRLATFPPGPNLEDDIRQLGTAIVLHQLLNQSGQFANWSAVEQVTRAFIGMTDSMTFEPMGDLLADAGIGSLADVPDPVILTNLQTRLLTGELGMQSITSDKLFSPLSPEELKLPRAFTFFGQKFVLDSWAFSQVVFDKVHWPSDNCIPYCGATNICTKVVRRKPSSLDIAFSVLGNDHVAPEIISRIQRTNGVPFRDGLPYQHNLAAVRNVIAGQTPEMWTNNIYTAWLAALRALSEPTTGPEYPEAMRTRAWAMKTLNTQLASWTQLRHDTVLYAKQSYTPPVICSYPHGFVEPRPEFWRGMKTLAEVAASAISRLPIPFTEVTVPGRNLEFGTPLSITCELAVVKQKQLAALRNFSATMTILEAIAQKELNQETLSVGENDFLISTMEYLGICHQGELGYTGWYPGLFYQNVFWSYLGSAHDNNMFHQYSGCAMYDALVTDVHTDVPDPLVCDPGAVIHEGIGKVHLLMIAVDSGPDQMVYAGPVFSHYEFEVPGVSRMSDEEWKAKLRADEIPISPEWTRSFLARVGQWGDDEMLAYPNVAGWGASDSGQLDVPGNLTNAVNIGGQGLTGLAVRENGTVVTWGRNAFGETNVPAGLSNVVAVAGQVAISMALTEDGTVVAWGGGTAGGTGSPITNVPPGLSKVLAIAGSRRCALALKENGTVVSWGEGSTNVPSNLTNIVAVAIGYGHGLALKSDGTVTGWADNDWGGGTHGEAVVPPLINAVAIAAGGSHSLALRDDGTVVAWGDDSYGQVSLFRGLSNIVAIAAGYAHSVGLKADGTVISSRGYSGLASRVPAALSNAVAITAGWEYGLALVGAAPPLSEVPLINPTFGPEGFSASIPTQIGRVYQLEYANALSGEWTGLRLVAGTGKILILSDSIPPGEERVYRVRRW